MSTTGQIRRIRPKCPCCKVPMDLFGRSYASKVIIEGIEYFCNNPICYYDYSANKRQQ